MVLSTTTPKTTDAAYAALLCRFLPFGARRLRRLHQALGSWQAIWEASYASLLRAHLEEKYITAFFTYRDTITDPAAHYRELQRWNCTIITFDDPAYPVSLQQLYDAPAVLFVRGDISCLHRTCLAIVGTRRPTPYGERVTHELTSALAQAGITIVSGLALGIDAIAHRSCLQAHGATVAVLGCGLDERCLYPPQHRSLAQRIVAASGALVSEFAPGTPALRHHFPLRNRIISGLCRAVLVIEAPAKSGALITAKIALDQNRDVLAVPGSIFNDYATGTNGLIRDGAQLVRSSTDVLDSLGISLQTIKAPLERHVPTHAEAAILACLHDEPTHINHIARTVQLDTKVVNATLVTLELKGFVRSKGALYTRAN